MCTMDYPLFIVSYNTGRKNPLVYKGLISVLPITGAKPRTPLIFRAASLAMQKNTANMFGF